MFEIGDKVLHKKANVAGHIKRINRSMVTVERRDKPKELTSLGNLEHPVFITQQESLIKHPQLNCWIDND